MGKKKKKSMHKRSKEAIKEVCNNTFILGKFREVFGMYDYDQKDVSKALKRCIKKFLEEEDPDPDVNFKMSRFGKYDDDDDDYETSGFVTTATAFDDFSDKSGLKVVRKSKKNKSLDKYF